jgi:hypothetical protein
MWLYETYRMLINVVKAKKRATQNTQATSEAKENKKDK